MIFMILGSAEQRFMLALLMRRLLYLGARLVKVGGIIFKVRFDPFMDRVHAFYEVACRGREYVYS